MSSAQAKRAVVVLVLLAGAGLAAGTLRGGQRRLGPAALISVGLAAALLTLLAEVGPRFATALAATMAASVWLAQGEAVAALQVGARRLGAAPPVREVARPGGRTLGEESL